MSVERPRVVFAYDFDGTLAPGNMQEHAFIPDELGMSHQDFWAETKALAIAQRGDPILAYMHLMLEKARARNVPLTLESWRRRGANLPLFPGVEDWFERQNARARALELDLRPLAQALERLLRLDLDLLGAGGGLGLRVLELLLHLRLELVELLSAHHV